jgi:hypothetical protein
MIIWEKVQVQAQKQVISACWRLEVGGALTQECRENFWGKENVLTLDSEGVLQLPSCVSAQNCIPKRKLYCT